LLASPAQFRLCSFHFDTLMGQKVTKGKDAQGAIAPSGPLRAAEYVRMSTEHQRYSTENQQAVIRRYAAERGISVVRSYADEGRSGLDLEGRAGLRSLLRDVESGVVGFSIVLVLDVSRWGRFQDADESAYYEYICKKAGVRIEYCAEPFENDGSISSTIVKSLKRAMAGEYSRELSTKVFAGQCRLVELGFRQGGAPGFGLRRRLQAGDGTPKGMLFRGEQKSIHTDRVVLVPGPQEEIEVVRWMYKEFVNERRSEREIADDLNLRGILTDFGRKWSRATVHQVLTNEKYVGNNIFNRTSSKLKQHRVINSQEMWVRAVGAFEPIIDRDMFEAVQELLEARNRQFSDEEMLELLTALWRRHGVLSGFVIDDAEDLPSSSAYRFRFGSLVRAYRLIGYTPARDYRYIEENRLLRHLHKGIIEKILKGIIDAGGAVEINPETDLLTLNGEISVSLVVARALVRPSGRVIWKVRFDTGLRPELTVVVRMASSNEEPRDYYLFPRIDILPASIRMNEENGFYLDTYRVEGLERLYTLAARTPLRRAA
jgi:DNA invertase Pin-like site-specific DNA recombinase